MTLSILMRTGMTQVQFWSQSDTCRLQPFLSSSDVWVQRCEMHQAARAGTVNWGCLQADMRCTEHWHIQGS